MLFLRGPVNDVQIRYLWDGIKSLKRNTSKMYGKNFKVTFFCTLTLLTTDHEYPKYNIL